MNRTALLDWSSRASGIHPRVGGELTQHHRARQGDAYALVPTRSCELRSREYEAGSPPGQSGLLPMRIMGVRLGGCLPRA